MSIPNILTFMRIAIVPIMAIIFIQNSSTAAIIACLLFIVASITDWLDGYLARKMELESPLGAFLDPVADKLLVVVALLLLVYKMQSILLLALASIIICREIIISALREWMAAKGKQQLVQVSWLGKLKTSLQMLAIVFLLSQIDNLWGINLLQIGKYLLIIATALTIWSMLSYFNKAKQYLLAK